MWEYRAFVRKVYDGDTITVDFDLGFDILLKNQKIRLADINAPEVRGQQRAEGLISRDALRSRIANKWVIIKTKKDKKGKYGRWIGTVILDDENINEWLINEGFAKVYV
jgi:micrococcal nuclease